MQVLASSSITNLSPYLLNLTHSPVRQNRQIAWALDWTQTKQMVQILVLPATRCRAVVVVQLLSHVRLSNPIDYSTPGFPAFHYLSEFAQTHVYLVSDGIQPSHPLPPASPPALNFSQQVGSSHQVAKVLELQLLQMYKTSNKTMFRSPSY